MIWSKWFLVKGSEQCTVFGVFWHPHLPGWLDMVFEDTCEQRPAKIAKHHQCAEADNRLSYYPPVQKGTVMVANCKQDRYLFLVWESAHLALKREAIQMRMTHPPGANMDKALWIWVKPWGYSSTGYHWTSGIEAYGRCDSKHCFRPFQFSKVQCWIGTT